MQRVFRDHPTRRFAVRLWDGQEVHWGTPRDFTLVFRDAEAFRAFFASCDPAYFAEAYVDGRVDIEGDLDTAMTLSGYLRRVELDLFEKLRFAAKLVAPRSRHTVSQDARDVRAHYDLSDDFFRLFLDEKMIYSCAYFGGPDCSLEEAQERKLELVCRKLCLQPGEAMLDVGCGWGGLVLWAAQRHGVRAHGITLSKNQAAIARRKVAEAGLAERITIDERHYRNLPAESFDKISSVGMYEHVGIARYPSYFAAVHRALRPGGLFLNHGITVSRHGRTRTGGSFIFRHVFPGAELDDIAHTQAVMVDAGFEILDVQSLRPHYAMTLREWSRRFRARKGQAAALVPAWVLRAWELYLAGCAQAFDDGLINVYQVLAAKTDAHGRSRAPLTRAVM